MNAIKNTNAKDTKSMIRSSFHSDGTPWGSAPNPARYQSIKELKAKTPKPNLTACLGVLLNALFIGKDIIAETRNFATAYLDWLNWWFFGFKCFGIGSRGLLGERSVPRSQELNNDQTGVLNA